MLLLLPLCAVAQERKVQNKPYIDFRRLHYGFFIGFHAQDMEFANNGFVTENGETWYADIANYNPGFSVGVLADLRLNTYLSMRAIPTMHFGQNTVYFREQNSGETSKQSLKTTYIAVPVHVKFAAERFNNYRPYVIAGVSPMINMSSKGQDYVQLKRYDAMINVGMGCDLYLPFFKLIPEIKFCYGLTNALDKNHVNELTDASKRVFSNSVNGIDGVNTKMFLFTLYFE